MDLVTHKGKTVLTIQTPSTGKLVLMKQGAGPGVEEWYQQIRENLRACFVKKIIESPLESTKATFHGNLFPSLHDVKSSELTCYMLYNIK